MMKVDHKGWFGICPVYFGGLDTEAPLIVERHWVFVPLMRLSEFFYGLAFTVCGFINPAFEPEWPLKVTGEIEPREV
ncbi:hypothetical protein [Thauera butanivorans]|uniref:hypothetical protein n=1 Tax=Thauera butanivorans TaxID=86174 RepID=UPI000AD133C8|nr:hypothetical protein [Thauera butanivorans]